MQQTWSTSGYRQHAGYVPALATDVLRLLAPEEGQRILDLGCGEGTLTERLVRTGALVVGVDSAPDFVASARARGLDVRLMDAEALAFNRDFDAVFSNAALHWMRRPDAVVAGVARALRPGGRFVGEFGGHANVAAIRVAMAAVLARRGVEFVPPWYFPTPEEYGEKLAAHGFVVDDIGLHPRPTALPTDLDGWLETFATSVMQLVPDAERFDARREVEALLRPVLCDARGRWTADYVRLRFAAHLD